MGLSNVGIFHTVIGIVALIAGLIGYARHGKIDLRQATGRIYGYGTLVASFTALGLSKQGGFNPGHLFAIFIAVLVVAAYLLSAMKRGTNRWRFVENFLLTFSFFLSWIPTVNETLTRVPVGHPLADGPADPLIGKTLLALLLLFVLGSIHQFRAQWKLNKAAKNTVTPKP